MKRIIALLALVLLAVPIRAEPVFRDLSWGDPVEALGEWEFLGERDGIKEYRRVNENMQLGPITAFDISYSFYDGRLARIYIAAYDGKGFRDLLRARYGWPDMEGSTYALWTLPDIDTTILLLTGESSAYALVMFYSNSIDAERYAKAQQELKEQAMSAW